MVNLVRRRIKYAGAALLWLAAAGALVAAVVVAQDVGFAVLRHRVEIMIAVVAVLVLAAAVPAGPVAAGGSLAAIVRAAVGCVVAFAVLGAAQVIRVAPPVTGDGGPRTGDATVVLTVWLLLLGLVLAATVRVTGRHAQVAAGTVGVAAGCGFAAAAVWLGSAALLPAIASSNAPAFLAMMATAAVAAYVLGRRTPVAADNRKMHLTGAAMAAMVTAAAVAAAIGGLLPLSHTWVRNSAPPWEAGARLVDPIGLLVLAAALAVVVALAGTRTRARP